MKLHVLGNRSGPPAFFDMGARFKPANAGWYGGAFRMGDRCAAHVWLGDWRHKNPTRKLVVIEDSVMPGTEASRHLDGLWLFNGIADELWQVEQPGEVIPRPPGQTLYHVTMWRIWRWLLHNRTWQPTLRPKPEALEKSSALLKAHGLSRFASVQPLFDAGYDTYRNGSVGYWGEVVRQTARHTPLVVLGDGKNAKAFPLPPGAVGFWELGLTPMESLAVISQAALHIGGATGTTLWSTVFKTPTLAVYKFWGPHPGKLTDTRPLPFGAPLVYACLDHPASEVAFKAEHMFNGTLTQSTPMG